MTELDPYQWVLDGFDVKAAGMGVIDTDGLEDAADVDVEQAERWGDGTHTGLQRVTSRAVTLTIGHNQDTDEAAMGLLRQVTAPRTNRQSQRLARFRHEPGEPTKRFLYVPFGKPLTVPGDQDWLSSYRFSKAIAVRIFVRDPYLYADTPTVTPIAAGDTETIVNDGTIAATSVSSADLGAWTWTVTVASGGCTDPSLAHADFDEAWVLPGSFTSGQEIVVDARRGVTVDGVPRYNSEGPDDRPAPLWPALRPGDNDIIFDVATGDADVVVTTRSTW